ncbi:MAG TPA: TcfC E-set like domain-containing protein [Sphingobium sp.]|uniref:TcfC E-set like domain-containing protein n=1 Tax=Sphingobium sp. TaxID=1912891 RepID=UPI002ED22F21
MIAFAHIAVAPALAQTAAGKPVSGDPQLPRNASSAKLQALPPAGFEGLDNAVSTEFDVVFQDRSIGAFRATFKDGQFSFDDPAAVAKALGSGIDTAAVTAFLSRPLAGNEQFRCRPGVVLAAGCGTLPGDTAGVIVNPESFSVSLFLSRQYLISMITGPRMLGPAMSGPSLIQTARFSVAKDGSTGASYGGTFDTLASFGQTSIVAQTTLSNTQSFQAQQIYAQHIWSNRRAALGMLQDYQSLVFSSYRLVGGEFGSFYGTMLDATNDTATPLEVLLPQRAQVEIYRNEVLVTAARYDAGLQLLNTAALPEGSYTVRIVARDGDRVLLDQTRTFSKISNLVPPGKTAFRIRAGERVEDNFVTGEGFSPGFLPKRTGELIVSASAQRRLGNAMAGSVTVSSFASRVYGESSLQVFRGKINGLAGAGVGSDGTYSALVSANLQIQHISFYLSARTTKVPQKALPSLTDDRYRAFFRSQDTLFGSVQAQVLGGSLGLTGSYSRSPDFPERYAVGVQYNRSVNLPWAAGALLSTGVTKSDYDTRFGISVSFFKRVDRKTTASFTGGASYVTNSEPGVGGRTGFSPVGEAILSRREQVGPVDVVGEGGAGTDADGDRAFGRIRALSPYGTGDAGVQWQQRAFGTSNLSYLLNGQTGFAIGGGGVKIGMRDPAESMVMLDLTDVRAPTNEKSAGQATSGTNTTTDPSENSGTVAAGGYRVTIDGRPYDYIEPGRRIALGLPAFKEYSIGLKPEGAPQFDIEATRRKVTVYPGNVVRLRFEARRVISLFGQALAEDGTPLAGARVEAGTDYAVADDHGYFTITAPLSSQLTVRRSDGTACVEREIASLIDSKAPSLLYRFGKIRCETTGKATSQNTAPDGPAGNRSPSSVPTANADVDPVRAKQVIKALTDANSPGTAQPDAPHSGLALLVAREFERQFQ